MTGGGGVVWISLRNLRLGDLCVSASSASKFLRQPIQNAEDAKTQSRDSHFSKAMLSTTTVPFSNMHLSHVTPI
jgi:hypothetical protein